MKDETEENPVDFIEERDVLGQQIRKIKITEKIESSDNSSLSKFFKSYFLIGISIDAGLSITQTVRMQILRSGYEMLDILTALATILFIIVSAVFFSILNRKYPNKGVWALYMISTFAILICSYILSLSVDFIISKIS
ncbi:MAG TPA: hypothetical protein VNG53_01710 [Bacteroidia bacterium]|nr:hypothetical protein [Bacteroidia bacterium]